MIMHVKTLGCKIIRLELELSDTFSVVKSKIYEKEGIEPCLQRLVLSGGEVLDDSETISELKISKRNLKNEGIIYLILRLREPELHNVTFSKKI